MYGEQQGYPSQQGFPPMAGPVRGRGGNRGGRNMMNVAPGN